MKLKLIKPELVIAGPGAGKTHNMVQNILNCIGDLHPTKFCVVITYTNAATEEIKSRLAKNVKIPANVFIGTIHSFLNKFVIIPYLSLLDNNISIDKTFLQISSDDIVKSKMRIRGNDSAIIRKNVYKYLNSKGLITFDQTIDLTIECLKNKTVKNIICRRLKYLFIDEFQDINNKQFDIIETIRKGKRTKIYCVGDPEQYISGFSNRKAEYKGIPILKICGKKQYSLDFIYNNHRCSFPITNFLNKFNSRLYQDKTFQQQKVLNKNISKHKINYINSDDLDKILFRFKELYESEGYKSNDVFILAKKNEIVEKVSEKLPLSNVLSKSKVIGRLELMINSITTLCKKSEYTLITEANISKFEFRKIVLRCLKKTFVNDTDFKEFIEDELGINLIGHITERKHSLLIDMKVIRVVQQKKECSTISNIHNAKGLERTVVLCIAKTQKELEYWLETNSEIRTATVKKIINGTEKKDHENDDYSRLGYVAFSRAKELLCIACLEKIDSSLVTKLNELGVIQLNTKT